MSEFKPAWWLRNGHLQTLYPAMLRPAPVLPRVREKLRLRDGDWLHLDWRLPRGWRDGDAPLVLVMHGLAGCSGSAYVVGLQQALEAQGWASVAMNGRGASGEPNDHARAYHAGAHDDVADVLHQLAQRYPDRVLAIVGFSLGGVMTLNALAHETLPPQLRAAAAVSVPLDLAACSARLDQGFSRLYRRHLLQEMHRFWQRKAQHLARQGQAEPARFLRQRLARGPYPSFRAFDDAIMSVMHGFDGVQDYYRRCSPLAALGQIRRPTLILQAADDPFLAGPCYPAQSGLPAGLTLEVTAGGGHVGFVEAGSRPRQPRFYTDRRVPAFLAAALAR